MKTSFAGNPLLIYWGYMSHRYCNSSVILVAPLVMVGAREEIRKRTPQKIRTPNTTDGSRQWYESPRSQRKYDQGSQHEGQSRKEGSWREWILGVVVWGAIIGGVNWLFPANTHDEQAKKPTAESNSSEPGAGAVSGRDDSGNPMTYSDVVRWTEWEVPALNPQSPKYDPGFKERVEDSRDRHMDKGFTERTAVIKAVRDLTVSDTSDDGKTGGAEGSGQGDTWTNEESGGCVLSGTMTDQDYRDCGITPPSSN
ncbi:MAG: hypothetical protein U5K73_08390 [Halofilum sp. (in: g-proteobacteria)]|nr:hypothetical protein [Halofilum sp. (in: g-proteobacteria)]